MLVAAVKVAVSRRRGCGRRSSRKKCEEKMRWCGRSGAQQGCCNLPRGFRNIPFPGAWEVVYIMGRDPMG